MYNEQKLIAAYRCGCLGENVFDAYFPLIAGTILDNHPTTVDEKDVQNLLKKRYGEDFELPLVFLRQVLSEGVRKKCFVDVKGKYSVDWNTLSKYTGLIDENYSNSWTDLINMFYAYCLTQNVPVEKNTLKNFILDILDTADETNLTLDLPIPVESMPPMEFCWYQFVKKQHDESDERYRFISSLSMCNITKQALFYIGDKQNSFENLKIYLDSPIIFSILGMDDKARTDSYLKLIKDAKEAGCQLHVLDNDYNEVVGIMSNSAGWATSANYNLQLANNAGRYFHDSGMSSEQISEFIANVETNLNQLGITIQETNYNVFETSFQEDENKLGAMIADKYKEQGHTLSDEKQKSIDVDVRSIVMIYRMRMGQKSTQIQTSHHLLLTSNNVIANVSKTYQNNISSHIPACISVDLFGAILWLSSPAKMVEYQKDKLLADCYAFLKPSPKMLEAYLKSLENLRSEDKIEEKNYLFLRSHKVVLEALVNVTKGDYANFNSRTYLEVYEEIKAISSKQYLDEASAHAETRSKLEEANSKLEQSHIKNQELSDSLFLEQQKNSIQQIELNESKNRELKLQQTHQSDDETIRRLSNQLRNDYNKKIKYTAYIFYCIIVLIPIFSIELLKITENTYIDLIFFAVIVIFVVPIYKLIGKKFCEYLAKKIIQKPNIDNN